MSITSYKGYNIIYETWRRPGDKLNANYRAVRLSIPELNITVDCYKYDKQHLNRKYALEKLRREVRKKLRNKARTMFNNASEDTVRCSSCDVCNNQLNWGEDCNSYCSLEAFCCGYYYKADAVRFKVTKECA